MKFIRYFFAIIISLLAVYGGFQLYQQHLQKAKVSEEALQEMRDSGFDVGTGDSKEALASILQSDLGAPTSSFGMPPSDLGATSMAPETSAQHSGLPPSLRGIGSPATVVAPEAGTTTLPFSPATEMPTQTGQTSQSDQVGQMGQSHQFGQPFSQPFNQPNNSTLSLNSSVPLGTPGIIAPDFLSADNTSISVANAPDTSTQAPVLPEPVPLEQQINSTAITVVPQEANSATGFGNHSSVAVTNHQGNIAQSEAQVVSSQPSPYTFGVVVPPGHDINTADSQLESQPVVVAQLLPGANPMGNPCDQQTMAYQPSIALPPQVQPLPPIDDPATMASVSPPVFIPRLNVTALPPVENETTAASVNMLSESGYASSQGGLATSAPSTPVLPESLPNAPDVSDALMAITMPPQNTLPPNTLASIQPAITQQAVQQPLQQAQQTTAMQQPGTPSNTSGNVVPLPQSGEADISPEVVLKVSKIGELLTKNEPVDAYEQLSNMYFYDEMTPQEQQYVSKHLDMLAGGLLFSKRQHILETPYVVKAGDTLESIAIQYKITSELLGKLNGIAANESVVIGTTLKVIRGPLDARIYPNRHELVVISRGNYACRFPISVGSSYAGQTGTFTVQEKAQDRAYQLAPGLGTIPPNDPSNPLGNRWIELSKEQGTIGVHGTNSPQSIGSTRQSAGFFGLREQDISEVYDMLVVGSNVTIVR